MPQYVFKKRRVRGPLEPHFDNLFIYDDFHKHVHKPVISGVQPGFMLVCSPSGTDKTSLGLDKSLLFIYPINCSVISTFKSYFSNCSTTVFFFFSTNTDSLMMVNQT
jgi:hypothetical protein